MAESRTMVFLISSLCLMSLSAVSFPLAGPCPSGSGVLRFLITTLRTTYHNQGNNGRHKRS